MLPMCYFDLKATVKFYSNLFSSFCVKVEQTFSQTFTFIILFG